MNAATTEFEPRQAARSRRAPVRWLVRGAVLVAAIVALQPSLVGTQATLAVPALSPWVAAATILATRTVRVSLALGFVLVAVVLVRRRFFCRWLCPTGLCLDGASRLGRVVGSVRREAPEPAESPTAGPPLLPSGGRPSVELGVPSGDRTTTADRTTTTGTSTACITTTGFWLAVATLGGACLGYPLLLWLDPLAMFSGFVSAFRPATWPAAAASAALFVGLLVLSLFLPGAWCARLCPLGALQDLLWRIAHLVAAVFRGMDFNDVCTANEPRPTNGRPEYRAKRLTGRVIFQANINSPSCRGEDSATRGDDHVANPSPMGVSRRAEVNPTDRVSSRIGWRLARRSLVGGLIGAACGAGMRAIGVSARRPLRPPGARAEGDFTGLCIRCGNCARSCPSGILLPDLGGQGLAGLLTPIVSFQHDYCREDCVRCTQVCPTGAIGPLTRVEKRFAFIGLAQVDMERCLLNDGRDCSVCRNQCPYEAISLIYVEADDSLTPRVDPQKCPGCGACEAACPTTPVKAIVVNPRSTADHFSARPSLAAHRLAADQRSSGTRSAVMSE